MKFTKKTPLEILKNEKHSILNFQNLYSVYLFNNNLDYRKALVSENNFAFPDGKILSYFLKLKQVRGPTFTYNFLKNQANEKQKHFFILPKEEGLAVLIERFPALKNARAYSPPYIQGAVFSKGEIDKMLKQIKKAKPDYVWVCIGNPKQEILANQLYKEYPAFYFNVGAAIDFVTGRKSEAPSVFRKIGMEWFYRFVTDFKHSKKKVFGSLKGLKYIKKLKVE